MWEVKQGCARVKRKFPGYVLVRMYLNDVVEHRARHPAVTGFVGDTLLKRSKVTGDAGDVKPAAVDHRGVRHAQKPEPAQAASAAGGAAADAEGDGLLLPPSKVTEVDLTVGDSVTVIDRPLRHAARHDLRDQHRRRQDHRVGRDLRPRDPGRTELHPDPEELTRSNTHHGPEEEGHRPDQAADSGWRRQPAPPVGPALGQHGVNIMEFCRAYNAATESQRGQVIPVEITVYEDRSFTFITKTPPAAKLVLKEAGLDKGAQPAEAGWHHHPGQGAGDRRAQDARPQRQRRGCRDEDHRGHRAVDGRDRHRLTRRFPASAPPARRSTTSGRANRARLTTWAAGAVQERSPKHGTQQGISRSSREDRPRPAVRRG